MAKRSSRFTREQIETMLLARSLIRDLAHNWPVEELADTPENVISRLKKSFRSADSRPEAVTQAATIIVEMAYLKHSGRHLFESPEVVCAGLTKLIGDSYDFASGDSERPNRCFCK